MLRGWMYQYVEKEGVLNIGGEELVDRVEAPGWLLDAALYLKGSLDAKYVRVHIEIDGPDRAFPIDFSPFGLKEFNVSMPVGFGAYLLRYDDTYDTATGKEPTYVGAVTPSNPIPFSKRFEVKLIAPSSPVEEASSKPIKYHATYSLAKIIDAREFRRSLLELLWPTHILGRGEIKP
jgi:hypothetical protein